MIDLEKVKVLLEKLPKGKLTAIPKNGVVKNEDGEIEFRVVYHRPEPFVEMIELLTEMVNGQK